MRIVDEPFEPADLSSSTVYEGKVWNLRSDDFALEPGGQSMTREYVDHTGAVAIVAIDDEERVVVIEQYRHPVGQRLWEIPAGLLDAAGETPLNAAKRELAEEVDLEARDWRVLADFATSPGGSNELIRIFLARGLTERAEAFERTDEEADMRVERVPLAEIVDAVLDRRVMNPSLCIGALAAHIAAQRGFDELAPADAPWPAREHLHGSVAHDLAG